MTELKYIYVVEECFDYESTTLQGCCTNLDDAMKIASTCREYADDILVYKVPTNMELGYDFDPGFILRAIIEKDCDGNKKVSWDARKNEGTKEIYLTNVEPKEEMFD